MVTSPQTPTFGAIEDTSLPLAVLAHGFPDTPFTWRHLGPDLAGRGYRVVAPWLPGYDAPTDKPISVGTYVRHLPVANIANVIAPYRASFNPHFADPDAEAETLATMQLPPVPTLYLHGAGDGAIGAGLLGEVSQHFPADGSAAETLGGVGHFL